MAFSALAMVEAVYQYTLKHVEDDLGINIHPTLNVFCQNK